MPSITKYEHERLLKAVEERDTLRQRQATVRRELKLLRGQVDELRAAKPEYVALKAELAGAKKGHAQARHNGEQAAAQRDALADQVHGLLGAIGFYIGPNARVGVSRDTVRKYERLHFLAARAQGKCCPYCDDEGRDKRYGGEHRCRFLGEPLHKGSTPEQVAAEAAHDS